MSAFNFLLKNSSATRTALVLQDKTAYWIHIVDGKVKDKYIDTITDNPDRSARIPFWLNGSELTSPHYIELVLDTTLDEIDRVSVAKADHWIIDRYRCFATLFRLRKDFPQASVYPLPQGYNECVAAVMHPEHPACWGPWLTSLQQLEIVFHQVCTSTELIARWAHRFSGKILVVMQSGSYQRHLLVDAGAAIFLRSLSLSCDVKSQAVLGEDATLAAIEQSVEYLASAVNVDTDNIRIIGIDSGPAMSSSDSLPNIAALNTQESLALSDDTAPDALLAMLTENSLEYESAVWRYAAIHYALEPDLEVATSYRSRLVQSLASTRLGHSILPVFRQSGSLLAAWPLLGSATRWIEALSPSVQYLISRRRIALMMKTSVVMAAAATVALSVAMVNGIASARALHSQMERIRHIDSSIARVKMTSMSEYAVPKSSAVSLFLSDQLVSLAFFKPQSLLGDIATAVTAVPGVVLDQMVWAMLESDETYASLSYALASVGHRQSLELHAQQATLQLELSGRATGDTLAKRKLKLDAFVIQLQNLAGALDVHVIESPADAALSSNIGSHGPDTFRLLLKKGQR